MARQSTSPVDFKRSIRKDQAVLMSSGRAGEVMPVAYAPLLAGDSASGRVAVDIQLKEMPRPLLNGVMANVQAWFIPKSAFPSFPGRDELMSSYTKKPIKTLLSSDRSASRWFRTIGNPTVAVYPVYKKLGLHMPTGSTWNIDLLDAFALIYNFRLAAHSSKLARMKYVHESGWEADHTKLPRAFWPSSRLSSVVPDYERALIMGSLDLDVIAGEISYSGNIPVSLDPLQAASQRIKRVANGSNSVAGQNVAIGSTAGILASAAASSGPVTDPVYLDPGLSLRGLTDDLTGSFVGDSIGVSLADIDKARTTQAFAKLRSAYAGNDSTGFDNDDQIVALLMQGIAMPQPDDFKRPWLLDSKRVPVGFAERHATDAANLDASVTVGRASATLSLNVPKQDVTGVIIVTVEVLPERIDERMADEWMLCLEPEDLPNALRDVQRPEPVDLVLNRRVDAKHAAPDGLYGYEPMNNKWNRNFTRLGGDFFMATPGGGFAESRSAIWQTEIVDPAYNSNHFLAPSPFPHDVFADQTGDAFEVVCRHDLTIAGITQIGDPLVENNDDYDAVVNGGLPE